MIKMEKPCRIVMTGGPGAGKTTAADLIRREIGEKIIVVPEAATMLFAGGFPRYSTTYAVEATQKAIYSTQCNLEDVQVAEYPDRILLCDRGTLDGSVYWPKGSTNYFDSMGTTLEREFERYDAVVFFETAAVGDIDIEGGNPYRQESIQEAIELDHQLRKVWEQHPNFTFVPHNKSFIQKLNNAIKCVQKVIADHNGNT
jgi:predicted ATPase